MAVLSDEERVIVGLRILSNICRSGTVDCTDSAVRDAVLAAVNAADAWAEEAKGDAAPATGYNGALPTPFKTWATAREKAMVLALVLMHRFNLDV